MPLNNYKWVIKAISIIGMPSVQEITSFQYLNYDRNQIYITESKIKYYIQKGLEKKRIQEFQPFPKNYHKRYSIIDRNYSKTNKIKPPIRISLCIKCKDQIVQRISKKEIKKHINKYSRCELKNNDCSSIHIPVIGKKYGITLGCSILGMLFRKNSNFVIEFPYNQDFIKKKEYINDFYQLTNKIRQMGFGSGCIPTIQWIYLD